ncbi:uncharacterized protein LOC110834736 isoform X2 [Zootermopsis nevadensis]|uniref:uncharacterized protein LOC110834736 isoform X2 n=1 Tax=Zootermopsis nevadensis TaxID=136037 RepID=UPI000B8E2879|nr:uncharacterized protein LOC110834736 isoform X2 [Zootermopsis nevadensis]
MQSWGPVLFVATFSVFRLTEGREGRVIFMNTDQSVDIALQVIVPFGVALPMVKKEGREGRRERTEDKIPDHEHPVYGIRLARLDFYFNQLEIDSEICRRKFLCELAENPEDFSPLSDIFFKQLELWFPEDEGGRYSQYVIAAQHGVMSAENDTQTGSCEHHFSSCRSEARKIFDMDAINFWKFLGSAFNFRISE